MSYLYLHAYVIHYKYKVQVTSDAGLYFPDGSSDLASFAEVLLSLKLSKKQVGARHKTDGINKVDKPFVHARLSTITSV